jgi:glycosyltransferase involved in cell wall biosynthesis
MKKILFLTPDLPYPPNGGGKIRSWMLLEYLSARYDLHICLFTKTEKQKNYEYEFLKKLKIDNFYSEYLNKERNFKNLISSYKSGVPLTVYRYFSNNFKNHIEKIIEQFDTVFIDHFSMAQYIPYSFKGKKIMHTHNAEYILWERKASLEKNPLNKFLILIESRRVKEYEKSIYKNADKILCVSSNDVENIEKIGIDKNKIELIPATGENDLLLLPDIQYSDTEKYLFYAGTLSWDANLDGLIWFMKNCWSKITEKNPEIKLYIAGSSPDKKLKKIVENFKNIILLGYVENLEHYYSKCRVFIAPLRFGSGIKVKILNAMCRGIPTVTTPIGAEGIESTDMVHLGIAESPEEFIDKIDILLNEKTIWEKLRGNSKILMKEKYNWNKICTKLDGVLE